MVAQKPLADIAGSSWDPAQYDRFSDHRLRPALELLDRIPSVSPRRVIDLGCGNGRVTGLLAERWPTARVQGIDSSSEMLAMARAEANAISWQQADIAHWRPDEAPDVIYSNAALHWLDNHQTLFRHLLAHLAPEGWLAVQMPRSWQASSHRLMRETLASGGVGGQPLGDAQLRGALARQWVADSAFYYHLLAGSTNHLDIWETEYLHRLDGVDPVLEWVSSTGLRPVFSALSEQDRVAFLADYRARLRLAYPRRPDGHTVYPFRRLFLVAQKQLAG